MCRFDTYGMCQQRIVGGQNLQQRKCNPDMACVGPAFTAAMVSAKFEIPRPVNIHSRRQGEALRGCRERVSVISMRDRHFLI